VNPKLAFIDHSFHQKTKASSFLIELLGKEYDVETCWDESWLNGKQADLKTISAAGFDTVVFFQVYRFPAEELELLRDKQVIVFPMFDACPPQADHFWQNYFRLPNVKFINFSRALHAKLTHFGFNSKYVRYFPSTNNTPSARNSGGDLTGFFWQRTGRLTWNHVRELIQGASFKKFYLHLAVDPPGCEIVLPDDAEKEKYHIEIIDWFADREEYLRVVKDADVFFAPRRAEGIGMSFLEAMALGKCAAAANNSTMNEYIDHGATGLLYDPDRPAALDLSKTVEIGRNAAEFIAWGHRRWLGSQDELMDFIRAKSPGPPKKPEFGTVLYFRQRRMVYKFKKYIKKRFPGLARALSGIKR
jgi:glycosyltransferase involved in cell wall biosynthesis